VTPEQKAELVAMLQQLTPAEQRAIKYVAHGGHKCTDSTNLITCCGTSRCQACHIPHLKEVHTIEQLHAYQKFVNARSLTWQVREYKLPLPAKKQPKVNTRTRTTRAPREKYNPATIIGAVRDDQLEDVLAMIEARLKK